MRPRRWKPTRLLCLWDSPGKNTGVECHCLLQCMKVKSESEVAQSCRLLATPWTAAYQAPLSVGLSRQEYWSGVPLFSGGFPGVTSGKEPVCQCSNAGDTLPLNWPFKILALESHQGQVASMKRESGTGPALKWTDACTWGYNEVLGRQTIYELESCLLPVLTLERSCREAWHLLRWCRFCPRTPVGILFTSHKKTSISLP